MVSSSVYSYNVHVHVHVSSLIMDYVHYWLVLYITIMMIVAVLL